MWRNRYTAPTAAEETLEELSGGWPKRVTHHPLHRQHQLAKSLRPAYTCDSCHADGKDWSFLCIPCDFDLHPNCALEAELVEKAKPWPRTLRHDLHADHPLVKTRLNTFWCDSCGEGGAWWCFYCQRCDFSLHLHCALAPRGRPADAPLPGGRLAVELARTARDSYWCGRCAEEGKGPCYASDDFAVELHPRCAAAAAKGGGGLPRTVVHELHEHVLRRSRSSMYVCDKCWIEGRGWSFVCDGCNFCLHPKCAVEKAPPAGGWLEQMVQDRRRQEVLQQQEEPERSATTQVAGEEEDDREEGVRRVEMEAWLRELEQQRFFAQQTARIIVDSSAALLNLIP